MILLLPTVVLALPNFILWGILEVRACLSPSLSLMRQEAKDGMSLSINWSEVTSEWDITWVFYLYCALLWKIYIYPIACTCSIHLLFIIAYICVMITLAWFGGKTLCFYIHVHLPVSEIWNQQISPTEHRYRDIFWVQLQLNPIHCR